MHGLVNRSLQVFLQETYGHTTWAAISRRAGAPANGFEPMLSYDTQLTDALIRAAEGILDKPRAAILEDLGTFLVSNERMERVRRLLRFGGEDFVEFLHSLEDLHGRARLAVPDLDMPMLEVTEEPPTGFSLSCSEPFAGAGHVMHGVLSAMADDYGALVLLDLIPPPAPGQAATISVDLLDTSYTEGRSFHLASGAG